MRAKPRPADLREACVEEAFTIIEEAGVEGLSLREVARRLGVSHQAPYKHFPSRDHVVAEILARSFREFAEFLESRPRQPEPSADLEAMGKRYMEYARKHPLKYRLMFNTPMPDPKQHPAMMKNAQRAFDLLRARLQHMPLRPTADPSAISASLDALFVWATLHGLASILQSDTLQTLGLSEADKKKAISRCFARLSVALEPDPNNGP